jgi:hypothetical protein
LAEASFTGGAAQAPAIGVRDSPGPIAIERPFWWNPAPAIPESGFNWSSSMRILYLGALAILAGCASPPAAESPPKQAAALASAAEPAPAAAAAPAAKREFTPPSGYKKRVANGQTIYCAKIMVLGSRFPQEDCRSQSELEDMEMLKQGMRSEMNRRQAICGSATACASN